MAEQHEKALVPQIRFTGFTDPWEQRKLGEVAHFINGRAYSQNELLSSGKYPVLRVGNFYTNDSWYYSNLELEDKNYAYEGDLLYTWSATFGPHIWHGNKVIYHYHIWKVQLEAAFEKLFAFQLLERDKERILSDKNGSTMVHITKIGIENTSVLMPCSVIEQRQIGAFLDRLDSLITLHQRKYDKLCVLKKSMLDKMFPKGGSLYPEIRFAGFTNPWEQRKLGEVAHFINGRAYSQNELLSSGKYPVLRVGNFYTNDSWYYSNLELEDKNYAYEGDLLYTWSATFGPHIWHGNKVIYHYHIWKVQLEAAFEKLFAFQLLERDKERILSDKNGSTMVHITKIGIENTSVLMPCSVIEQRQIGAFLDRLDSLITLHQRKLELLRNIKKSMLDKMFV
ncbi:restriction endonuclease subunit S [Bifidobacterium adolescentis]|uniref:Restriction endonuclease subunit S n=1 Tax=Bifidobacterium adolescentis TaxID=1680 RepID=A0A6I6QYI8_BIFAD|nr:restriction endonuclease subunit S [Bifidobacterium adolescentis]QHB62404.1 restriction endonuclease subunit S [Bifidobacterium adolescentis]